MVSKRAPSREPFSLYTETMEAAPLNSSEFGTWSGRAIMLLDLDAFFASVEQLDHPEWRGKPVIVGGDADRHGVVSTCSYEAREYGVRSAMPASQAERLCPDAIWTHGRHDRYRELSDAVMGMILDETPYVEQVSIDEAFADITPTRVNREHPAEVARRIQSRVSDEVGVTCSVGVGPTKSVAKIASDMDKPHGLTVVYPGTEDAFLGPLPIKVMSGVGKVAQGKLLSMGIQTLSDLANADEGALEEVFGSRAAMMAARARGEDASAITTEREMKSVSHEQTFADVLTSHDDIHAALVTLLGKVARRLRRKGVQARTLSVKIRFADRSIRNAQLSLADPSNNEIELASYLEGLLAKVWRPGDEVRLLGVRTSGFDEPAPLRQEALFEDDAPSEVQSDLLIDDEGKREGLVRATDILKDKFGEDAVFFGSALRNAGNDTGSSSKHPARR